MTEATLAPPSPATSSAPETQAPISAQLRGETMAYATQSILYNLAGNLFEPFVGQQVQKYFSRHAPLHAAYGSYGHNLIGEIAGDISGAVALIGAEAVAPQQLHSFTRSIRNAVDPVYTALAEKVFQSQKNDPDYEKKMNDWKLFQERNLARSTIIATAGIAGNLVTQKVAGNPSPVKYIFAGKLASTALTTSLGLATRMALPNQTKAMDKWIGKTMFEPMIEGDEQEKPSSSNGISR